MCYEEISCINQRIRSVSPPRCPLAGRQNQRIHAHGKREAQISQKAFSTPHIRYIFAGHALGTRRGTGMIASSRNFWPHPGRVIRDLLCQLHAVWHGTEALVYSNHPREAAASSYLAIIFRRIAGSVPWFLRSTLKALHCKI